MLKDQQTGYHGDKYVQDIPILSLGLHNLKLIFSFFFILSFLADPELKQIIPDPTGFEFLILAGIVPVLQI